MFRKIFTAAIFFFLLTILPSAVSAGGWAIATVTQLPDEPVAGTAFTIKFNVRQHGTHFSSYFNPQLHFADPETGAWRTVIPRPERRDGFYTADVRLDTTGTWKWGIDLGGSRENMQEMPALEVVAAGMEKTAAGSHLMESFLMGSGAVLAAASGILFFKKMPRLSAILLLGGAALLVSGSLGFSPGAARKSGAGLKGYSGADLFLAKGCIVCHDHSAARAGYQGWTLDLGPDLDGLSLPAEYLESWLDDPKAIRPNTGMPDLDLTAEEISKLVAFLVGK